NNVRRLKPRVLVITGPDKSPAPHPAPLDLLYQPDDRGAVHIRRGLPTGAFPIDPREDYLAGTRAGRVPPPAQTVSARMPASHLPTSPSSCARASRSPTAARSPCW